MLGLVEGEGITRAHIQPEPTSAFLTLQTRNPLRQAHTHTPHQTTPRAIHCAKRTTVRHIKLPSAIHCAKRTAVRPTRNPLRQAHRRAPNAQSIAPRATHCAISTSPAAQPIARSLSPCHPPPPTFKTQPKPPPAPCYLRSHCRYFLDSGHPSSDPLFLTGDTS